MQSELIIMGAINLALLVSVAGFIDVRKHMKKNKRKGFIE
jgi:hypothetical protein